MAIATTDPASAYFNWLKTSEDAANIREMVYGRGTNILEAGDLTASELATNYVARKNAGETTKVLAITVQDAGEQYLNDWQSTAIVVVRIFDNGSYRNIRGVRERLIKDTRYYMERGLPLTAVDGQRRGVLTFDLESRTGYRRSDIFAADFESITFSVSKHLDES